MRRKTTSEFISHCISKHHNKYDYSLVDYITCKTKVKIICRIHGVFTQCPSDHLNGKGCLSCANDARSIHKRKSVEQFISDAKLIHNNKYDYSRVEYINARSKVYIKCNACSHIYHQRPNDHLRGNGCPKCRSSKGEFAVSKWLDAHNIPYIKEYTFSDCVHKLRLPFDFYLPSLNMCIEYDGIQHFIAIEMFGGESALLSNKMRDSIKDDYCHNNNIPILRISYWDINNINDILTEEIT